MAKDAEKELDDILRLSTRHQQVPRDLHPLAVALLAVEMKHHPHSMDPDQEDLADLDDSPL